MTDSLREQYVRTCVERALKAIPYENPQVITYMAELLAERVWDHMDRFADEVDYFIQMCDVE